MIAIWGAVGKTIYWTIGAVEGVTKIVGATRKLARKIRRAVAPSVDDTQPIPLTHRDVQRRAEQIRCASRPMGSKPPPGC